MRGRRGLFLSGPFPPPDFEARPRFFDTGALGGVDGWCARCSRRNSCTARPMWKGQHTKRPAGLRRPVEPAGQRWAHSLLGGGGGWAHRCKRISIVVGG